MKLDFSNDGLISLEDLKKGAQDLYEFMANYDFIVKANEIKNTLYDEAIKYMKSDSHRDNSVRQILPAEQNASLSASKEKND
jgi:hypothetical protein